MFSWTIPNVDPIHASRGEKLARERERERESERERERERENAKLEQLLPGKSLP